MTIKLTHLQKLKLISDLIPIDKNKKALADFLDTQNIAFFQDSLFTRQLIDVLRNWECTEND